jgi:hypothetical protein
VNTVGLTTIENLRMHVLRDSEDASADEKLVFYGEAMSQEVIDWCEREFLPDPAPPGEGDPDPDPVDRVFAYDGSGNLDLAPYDLRDVDTVTIDDQSGSTRELAVSEYRLNPRGRTREGTYLEIGLPGLFLPRWTGFDWTVTISGFWGMVAVPKPVELAVLVAVDDIMDNPASAASQQLGGYQHVAEQFDPVFDTSNRGGLPRAALRALRRYKRNRTLNSVQIVNHAQHIQSALPLP